MSASAERLSQSTPAQAVAVYEQPLSERMRTYLRLEFLYRQLRFHLDRPSPWDSRAALTASLDVIAILTRGDLRSEVLKELEKQLHHFDRLQDKPQVDENRLDGLLRNLNTHRQQLVALGPQYLQKLRENEFLNAVKHRSAIPGGTCEFDLPDYTHWLRQPYERRLSDINQWLQSLQPLCDSVAELLWLLREAGESHSLIAHKGIYQHTLGRHSGHQLLRIRLTGAQGMYPEISASHHRFTVRFMRWPDVEQRAVQVVSDVAFELKLC